MIKAIYRLFLIFFNWCFDLLCLSRESSALSKCINRNKLIEGQTNRHLGTATHRFNVTKASQSQGLDCKMTNLQMTGLDDAYHAGGPESYKCTLILTQGPAIISLVTAGLSVIADARDKYGIHPMPKNLVNVRHQDPDRIGDFKDEEVENLLQIIGLDLKKTYQERNELASLRYGKIMIMVDQDADGCYMKGLLINLIHHYWPNLLEWHFLEVFFPPICKATKGFQVESFYTLRKFKNWKVKTCDYEKWKIIHFRYLGSITANEMKDLFRDIDRHRMKIKYTGQADDDAMNLAFSEKMSEHRLEWLNEAIKERKARFKEGSSEIRFYDDIDRVVSLEKYINEEFVHCLIVLNGRSIPSVMDGLNSDQRQILSTCFQRNLVDDLRVDHLASSVASETGSDRSAASLVDPIFSLTYDYSSAQHLNLLSSRGQTGSRLQIGTDAAEPHHISVKLNTLARKLFPKETDCVLTSLWDDDLKAGYQYFIPILPMILVDGADRIGTTLRTKIPSFDLGEIVGNLERMIRRAIGSEETSKGFTENIQGEESVKRNIEEDDKQNDHQIVAKIGENIKLGIDVGKRDTILPMKPRIHGFRGTIREIGLHNYSIFGKIAELNDNYGDIEITELKPGDLVQSYKLNVLNPLLRSGKIREYKEYHTERTVRFVVSFPPGKFEEAKEQGLHQMFDLETTLTTKEMVLFDSNGILKRFETPEEILQEFYQVSLKMYHQRKAYIKAELSTLENQLRLINDFVQNTKTRSKDLEKYLLEEKYDSNPLQFWKENRHSEAKENQNQSKERDHGYLLEIFSLPDLMMKKTWPTLEFESEKNREFLRAIRTNILQLKRIQLEMDRNSKKDELNRIEKTPIQDIWLQNLKDFLGEVKRLNIVENKVNEKLILSDFSTEPSPFGKRINPPQQKPLLSLPQEPSCQQVTGIVEMKNSANDRVNEIHGAEATSQESSIPDQMIRW